MRIGFSKSGWGAFSLLLRHPEVFGRAAAWDAPLMLEQPNRYGMGAVFGSQENFLNLTFLCFAFANPTLLFAGRRTEWRWSSREAKKRKI